MNYLVLLNLDATKILPSNIISAYEKFFIQQLGHNYKTEHESGKK